ncbi:hypothetical protein Ddye_019736 [Dipteronia dyeriana]|uniref:Stigma-specific STIG1-like protein 1 n=1 Tax=Dipteronia dyeriana TaxID=168575 RepID=A0AAD9TYS5_9ROSI|nr:hypothetical protein Ddye_019736 [Dipteronia dyeriana]
MAFLATVSPNVVVYYKNLNSRNELEMDQKESITTTSTSLRGVSRLLAQQNLIANMTCDKFPHVCRQVKSIPPVQDCCKKKCVNVNSDRLNCGMCGYKCKYTEICCKGKCVNDSFDKSNCGGCNKKCKKGEFCVYGMCNYA